MEKMQRFVLGVCAALALAAAPRLAHAQTGGPGGGDPQRGAAIAARDCASCHGADGNGASPAVPKLAGQDPAYLYGQLWAFRQGQRPSQAMAAIASRLNDADLADVSAYYATRPVRPDPVTDAGLASAGEQIYYAGRPSCAMCHEGGGMPMMRMMGGGTARNAPRLAGQHALYTLQQLDAFASGARPGTVMDRVAAALGEPERRAVAEYLAGRR